MVVFIAEHDFQSKSFDLYTENKGRNIISRGSSPWITRA